MSNDDEIGEKSDMTRIEDLSEFLHQEDPEVNAVFESEEDEPPSTEGLPSLDDLEDDEEFNEFNPSLDDDDDEEDDQDSEDNDFSFSEEDEEDEEENDFSSESDFESLNDNDDEDTDDEVNFDSDEDFASSDDFESTEDGGFDSSVEFGEEGELDSEINFSDNEEDDEDSFESNNDFESESEDFSASFDNDEDQEELEGEIEPEEEETVQSFDESDSFDPPEDTVTQAPPTPVPTHIDRSEKFEDVKSFAKNITYGKIAQGGNPPFSVILRNIKFEEEVEDILIILGEHDLIPPGTETEMRQSLEGGNLLISQISEFAAIYLTHKFRRFDLDIQMGLSDELHPSKSYESDSVGLISKARVNHNKNETIRIDKSKVDIEGIITSTTPTLENFKIVEYLGIISDFIIVNEDELSSDESSSVEHERQAKGHVDQDRDDEINDVDLKISQSAIYSDLSEKLKPLCIKKNGNAIVGINYQITPLSDGSTYKISCSGSVVWIIDSN